MCGGGVVESGGNVAGSNGGGVAGSDAVCVPKEMSSSSCGMAPIRSASAPFCPLVGSTGCGRFRFRFAGGAGGDGLITALALLAVATTSFLRCVAASAAARGTTAVDSHAGQDGRVRDVVWRPVGEVEVLTPRERLKHHSSPAARSDAH
jgi:hypothetical protein